MTTLRLREIWQYPLKSGRGRALESVDLHTYGITHDRHLIAIDDDQRPGLFLTARTCPSLLQLAVTPSDDDQTPWQITDRRDGEHFQFLPAELDQTATARIWQDSATGKDVGDTAAEWLSDRLGQRARLIFWQPGDRHAGKYDLETTYADAAPLLITTTSTIAQACEWSQVTADARRFRPNLVIDGAEAFAEHQWKRLRIGNADITLLDDCTRCLLVNRDPETGDMTTKAENASTLKQLKTHHASTTGKPILGMNATLSTAMSESVRLHVGDMVTLID